MFPLYVGLVSYQKIKSNFSTCTGLRFPEALVAAQPNLVPYQELQLLLSDKCFASKRINHIYLQLQRDNNAIVPSHQEICSLEVLF